MRILFLFIMLAAVFGANFYVFLRVWQLLLPNLGVAAKTLFVAAGVFLALSPFIAVFLGGMMPSWLSGLIYKVGTAWFVILLFAVMAFLAVDILRLCGAIKPESFRGNWVLLTVVSLVVALVMTGGYINYRHPRRVVLDLEVDKPGTQPLKIVAISDLHLGYGIGRAELERWVERINAENPDAVLIAGDVVDAHIQPLYEKDIARALGELKAPHGVYISLGNHEYIAGVDQSLRFLESIPRARVVQDFAVCVDSLFYVVGRDDRSNHSRLPLADLTDELDNSLPIIVLDHQPYDLAVTAGAPDSMGRTLKNVVDLQISGHTHRGQVWPFSWLTDAMFEKAYGYMKKNGTHFYVSSGLGIWGGKFRIGTHSEYVVINIKP